MDFFKIEQERKNQLSRISYHRGNRDIIVYAVDFSKRAQISIDYSDVLPFTDMLSSLNGNNGLDVILHTPGGLADVVEIFVKAIRQKYKNVGVIIPSKAMSAGTIFTMAADEILMGKDSYLGPIDAQIVNNGKQYSADAFLEGLEKIKKEVEKTGKLNPAYIPILQNISVGEIQNLENAQKLSATLVKNWLIQYKFSHWETHTSTNKSVTEEDKKNRAEEIAKALGKHSRWLSHSRPLGIKELQELKLQITDYSENTELCDAITRYYVLLSMTFDTSGIYKIYETPQKQITKFLVPQIPSQDIVRNSKERKEIVNVELKCPKCGYKMIIQGCFSPNTPLQKNAIPFPADNIITCPQCKSRHNISNIRMDIEGQTRRKILQ